MLVGLLAGWFVVGVLSRPAMFLLAGLNPRAAGITSDDGFTMGQFTLSGSANLMFLVGTLLGVLGAGAYVVLRRLMVGPPWFRLLSISLGPAVVAGAGLVHTDGVDFTLLQPLGLAVALFVAVPGCTSSCSASSPRGCEPGRPVAAPRCPRGGVRGLAGRPGAGRTHPLLSRNRRGRADVPSPTTTTRGRPMDRNVTLGARGLLIAALVLLALAVAYLMGGVGTQPVPASASPGSRGAEAEPRTLVMTGRGESSAVPDRLTFTLTSSAKRTDLGDALDAASAAMGRSLGVLRGHDVRREDVRTTGLRMHPEYHYPASGPRVLTGYRVTQTARVTVRDLGEGGEAIAEVVRSGDSVVEVGGVRLEVGDTASVLESARDDAVRVATAKAEQYAAATGQRLGQVLSVREVTARSPRPQVVPGYAMRDRATAELAVPIRAGEQESGVTVEIVWSLS